MFEDTEEVKRSRNSKKGKRTKGKTMIYKPIHRKLNIDQHEQQMELIIIYEVIISRHSLRPVFYDS